MADVKLRLIINGREVEATVQGVEANLKKVKKESEGVRQKFAEWGQIVTGFKSSLELIKKAWSYIQVPLDTAGEFERYKVQFEVLLGSADAAGKRINELSQFAAKTPFEFPQVIRASKQLEVMTGGAISTGDSLKMLGDVSSGVGTPIDELSMWFGRLYDSIQSGRPFGESMMRLQELGAVSGATRAEIEKMQKEGKSATEIWDYFSESMGRFNGMMEKQSGIYEGMSSNLGDSATMLLDFVGQKMMPLAKGVTQSLTSLIDAIVDAPTKIAQLTESAEKQKTEFDILSNRYLTLASNTNRTEEQQAAFNETIKDLQDKYPNYLKNVDLHSGSYEDVKTALDEAKTSLDKYTESLIRQAVLQEKQQEIADITASLIGLEKMKIDNQAAGLQETFELSQEYGDAYVQQNAKQRETYVSFADNMIAVQKEKRQEIEGEIEQLKTILDSILGDAIAPTTTVTVTPTAAGDKTADQVKQENALKELQISNMQDNYDRQLAEADAEYELALEKYKDYANFEEIKTQLTIQHANKRKEIETARAVETETALEKLQTSNIQNRYDRQLAEADLEYEAKLREYKDYANFEQLKTELTEEHAQKRKEIEAARTNETTSVLQELQISNIRNTYDRQLAESDREYVLALEKYKDYENFEEIKTQLTIQHENERAEIEQERLSSSLRTVMSYLSNVQGLFSEHTAAYKLITVAQIVWDTYQAAIAAYKSVAEIPLVGPFLAPAAAAAAMSFGNQAQKGAEAQEVPKAETGGWLVGKRHSQGGIGIEAEDGEFIVNRNSAARNAALLEAINNDTVAQLRNDTIQSIMTVQVESQNIAAQANNRAVESMFDQHFKRFDTYLGQFDDYVKKIDKWKNGLVFKQKGDDLVAVYDEASTKRERLKY